MHPTAAMSPSLNFFTALPTFTTRPTISCPGTSGYTVGITSFHLFRTWYAVLGKRFASRYDALTMTTYNFFFGALFVLPIAIHRAIAFGPHWLALPWPGWAALLYMALFSSSLAYLFYFWLLRYLEVTQLAACNYLLPVSASLLGILLLNERGSWPELLGGALALAGVYFVESIRIP
jgi:drug/metabolite transporter (DMT)-like permease